MRSDWLAAGALVTALLSLACCGSALLFLLFGISFAAAGSLDVLVPYRLFFQVLSVILLLLAWGRLYRRRSCVRNNRRTFWLLVAVSLMLVMLLWIPYMEFE